MANISRLLGSNIRISMADANINTESFAHLMGYSHKDAINVIEGKKIIPPFEINRIAKVLGTTKERLMDFTETSSVPQLQYRKSFTNPDNLELIMDLIDEYVELCEVN